MDDYTGYTVSLVCKYDVIYQVKPECTCKCKQENGSDRVTITECWTY